MDWKVLEEDEFGLLYQWSLPKIEQAPAHWELTRVLRGARDLHRVSLISDRKVAEDQAAAWRTALQQARLVKKSES